MTGGEPIATQTAGTARDQIAGLRETLTLRAKSLIVTIYGDALMPRGGSCWLGSLIGLVEPLGLSERMVRTAVYRLSQDNLLTSEQEGRRSYYALTAEGRRQFESAQRRIYALPERSWDGGWLFVLLGDEVPTGKRDALKRELTFQGFATLAPMLFAHPGAEAGPARRSIAAHGLEDFALTLQATSAEAATLTPLRRIVARAWDLDAMDAQYRAFLEHFQPVMALVAGGVQPTPAEAFLLRTLLIHDYRRILLRDPGLPPELLPKDWSGIAANTLAADLYRHLAPIAERHLDHAVETLDGPLPPVSDFFFDRFGGLSN
jgi:phenylacetic acid degradation operon negative regulatory protein